MQPFRDTLVNSSHRFAAQYRSPCFMPTASADKIRQYTATPTR